MTQAEKIIEEVDSSMTMEGLPLTGEDRRRIRRCLEDPSELKETLRGLIQKHTQTEDGYVQRL